MESSVNLVPLPPQRCACGCERLTFVEDISEFSSVVYEEGRWRRLSDTEIQLIDAPDSQRLFCPQCGTYYVLPEGIEEAP